MYIGGGGGEGGGGGGGGGRRKSDRETVGEKEGMCAACFFIKFT